jgi:hypothetical protein
LRSGSGALVKTIDVLKEISYSNGKMETAVADNHLETVQGDRRDGTAPPDVMAEVKKAIKK